MGDKVKKISPQHHNFLVLRAKGLSYAHAFMEAFQKEVSESTADKRGRSIEKSLEDMGTEREKLKIFNPSYELSYQLKELRGHTNPFVQLKSIDILGRAYGWMQENVIANLGFQVIIGARSPDQIEQAKTIEVQAPKKPSALPK